jgi:hypothetical protein
MCKPYGMSTDIYAYTESCSKSSEPSSTRRHGARHKYAYLELVIILYQFNVISFQDIKYTF